MAANVKQLKWQANAIQSSCRARRKLFISYSKLALMRENANFALVFSTHTAHPGPS